MSLRQFLIGFLIFSTLVIPIVQLSFGFHYIDKETLCPLLHDIMLLMAIGGFFEVIFFAACFGFIYKLTPSKYKVQKAKTAAQQSAQGSNRASSILIGKFSTKNLSNQKAIKRIFRMYNGHTRCVRNHLLRTHTVSSLSKFFQNSIDWSK